MSSRRRSPGSTCSPQNLANVEQARPVIEAYPTLISEAMGLAIVAALLGEKEPQAALDEAASQTNDALALSG